MFAVYALAIALIAGISALTIINGGGNVAPVLPVNTK